MVNPGADNGTAYDHGLAVLGAILTRKDDATGYVLARLSPEHFTDPVAARLFGFARLYHERTGAGLSRFILADMARTEPPGRLDLYEEVYDQCCDQAPDGEEYRWSVDQLRELHTERVTGEAITRAMKILTQGDTDGKRELRGHADAREYLRGALADAGAADGDGGLAAVDWHQLWAEEPDEPDWLIEPVIQRGQGVSLYAIPGTGKSLLAFEMAAAKATGRGVLGNPPADPVDVTYIDAENRRLDHKARARDMGYKPSDLGRLHLYSFPDLEPLDTAAGGIRLVSQAIADKSVLVVIDATSRVIEGKENDSDTFIGLYRHTIGPLRKAGIAVLRLDNQGKDTSRGSRGSSAKKDDVDVEWELISESGGQFALHCRKDRSNQAGDEPVMLARRAAPLRHTVISSVVSTKAGRVAADLTRLGATGETSKRVARDMLGAAGIKASNAVILDALRQIKARTERDNLINSQ
jgi:hypothetical protein